MRRLDSTGDTTITEWDAETITDEEIEEAAAAFRKELDAGFFAYGVKDGKGEVIRDFDPAADEIVLRPAIQGG